MKASWSHLPIEERLALKTGCSFALSLLVASCASMRPTPVGSNATLVIRPQYNFNTQTVVPNIAITNIATLDIIPYLQISAGAFSPVSSITGNATTYGASDMLKLSQASPSVGPSKPFILTKFKGNQNYRIFAKAYLSNGTQVSQDSRSYVDVSVTNDDRPQMATLPIYAVNPTTFGATTSVTLFTAGHSYDYLNAILWRSYDGAQVATAQSDRLNPTFNFTNLQGNTNYSLEIDAYVAGTFRASNSLAINIANDNAPATSSWDFPVPYLVTTFAGSAAGYADGAGNAAQFNQTNGGCVDSAGNLYIADANNNLIRKVTSAGVVSTFAGGGGATGSGYADGTGTAALLNHPLDVAVDRAGNLFVVDYGNNLIRKITNTGVVSTFAGGGGGTISGNTDGNGTAAKFNNPQGICVDGAGTLFVADWGNSFIRKVTSTGVVSTIAGGGGGGYADGTGNAAKFFSPRGICVDGAGNLYITDYNNNLIRKMNAAGMVSTFAGGGGTTTSGYANGTGTAALFYHPSGVCVDGAGTLYVTDYDNHLIRKVTSTGVVSTIAGGGGTTTSGNTDGTGTAAKFNRPLGICVDGAGSLYVADTNNSRIRKVY